MLEGMLLAAVASWVIAYFIRSAISHWDESKLRSRWEFDLIIHQSRLSRPNLSWMAQRYHRWRSQVLTRRLADYDLMIQHTNQESLNRQQP